MNPEVKLAADGTLALGIATSTWWAENIDHALHTYGLAVAAIVITLRAINAWEERKARKNKDQTK